MQPRLQALATDIDLRNANHTDDSKLKFIYMDPKLIPSSLSA